MTPLDPEKDESEEARARSERALGGRRERERPLVYRTPVQETNVIPTKFLMEGEERRHRSHFLVVTSYMVLFERDDGRDDEGSGARESQEQDRTRWI
ncbi:hypothetical protein M408DRAFT_330429, partial [Serendipita vermifera MAFF 305830]